MNIKFTIEYDGTNYHGWQIQKNIPTIQGELKKAFEKILPNEKINIIGSGRTDQGVHAYGQVASLKISQKINLEVLFKSVNGIINNNIYINHFEETDDEFNARYSAKKRIYKYYVNKIYSPFKEKTAWFINQRIKFSFLQKCAIEIIGTHNFSSLSKSNIETDNKECIIYESFWEEDKNELIYTIIANRFLHHMVRMLVGTMIEVSKGSITISQFKDMINVNISKKHIVTSPSNGLYLNKVNY